MLTIWYYRDNIIENSQYFHHNSIFVNISQQCHKAHDTNFQVTLNCHLCFWKCPLVSQGKYQNN